MGATTQNWSHPDNQPPGFQLIQVNRGLLWIFHLPTVTTELFCTFLPITLISLGGNSLRNYHYTGCNIPEGHRYASSTSWQKPEITHFTTTILQLILQHKLPSACLIPKLNPSCFLLMFLTVSLASCLSLITVFDCFLMKLVTPCISYSAHGQVGWSTKFLMTIKKCLLWLMDYFQYTSHISLVLYLYFFVSSTLILM